MSQIDREWDVIVIGAGLGGLSVSAKLSQMGMRTLVLEQHNVPGGYAHHFLRKVKGTDVVYDFDVALHQTGDLAPGRPFHSLLSELGVMQRIGVQRFEIAYRHIGPDHDFEVPADAAAYEKKLSEVFPEEASGVRDLFAYVRAVDLANGQPTPEAGEAMGLSLQQLLERHVRDERLQAIFGGLWGYLGSPPSQLSAFIFAQMWRGYHLGGCSYIQGGGQSLANALVEVIEESRGQVLLECDVTRILSEAGRICGVETAKGERFRAPVVVSNAPPPTTFNQLLDQPELAAVDREVADALPVALSVCQAYIGMRGDASELGLADRGRFVLPTYDADADWEAIERGDYPRHGYSMANHNLADPGHHPKGRSVIHVTMLANGRLWQDLDEQAYAEKKRDTEEYLIGRLVEVIPDARERIEICELGTPRTMERYSRNPLGSIYGYSSTVTSHSVHRPQPRTSVPGLYLAGAWTFPAGGFLGAFISGLNTARLVAEDVEGGLREGG
jgi:phytoene dehydrogenase-like protein